MHGSYRNTETYLPSMYFTLFMKKDWPNFVGYDYEMGLILKLDIL